MLAPELQRVALKDKEHMLRWAAETDRRWLVFSAKDLIEALWAFKDIDPETRELISVAWFQMIVRRYADIRALQPSGVVEQVQVDGKQVERDPGKSEVPTAEEWQDLIAWAVHQSHREPANG